MTLLPVVGGAVLAPGRAAAAAGDYRTASAAAKAPGVMRPVRAPRAAHYVPQMAKLQRQTAKQLAKATPTPVKAARRAARTYQPAATKALAGALVLRNAARLDEADARVARGRPRRRVR